MTGQAIAHIEKLRGFEGKTRAEAVAALGLCESYVIKLAKDRTPELAHAAYLSAGTAQSREVEPTV